MDHLIFGAELIALVICASMFAIAITGRTGFNDWEIGNLNKVAVLSAIVAIAIGALLFVSLA